MKLGQYICNDLAVTSSSFGQESSDTFDFAKRSEAFDSTCNIDLKIKLQAKEDRTQMNRSIVGWHDSGLRCMQRTRQETCAGGNLSVDSKKLELLWWEKLIIKVLGYFKHWKKNEFSKRDFFSHIKRLRRKYVNLNKNRLSQNLTQMNLNIYKKLNLIVKWR